MAVGSYALSLLERQELSKGNPRTAGAVILRLLGEQDLPTPELVSLTGLPTEVLQRVLGELGDSGLVEKTDDRYRLTERGQKAQYLVAS